MYSLFYRLIQKIILKRSFYDDFLNVIKTENIDRIIEIGCADSVILKNLNKDFFYDGFDIEENFIEKSKIKYSDNSKFSFEKKSIHEIDFKKYDIEKTIVLLIGVFHHVSDEYIKIFLNKTKLFKVYAIDAVRLDGQNLFTKLLMDFDKGKYVRSENHYKKLLNEYQFILARNKYLNFKYDHLISIKRLDVNKVREILKD
tara:strand:+ start:1731 stop:2330 length:600 start_codon:yes stop_codon:yes gene_type:complete